MNHKSVDHPLTTTMKPLAKEIPFINPEKIFAFFSEQPWSIFFNSAKEQALLGRYSFIAIDPFSTITYRKNPEISEDIFSLIKSELIRFPLESHADLPPFQGGAAGYFSYELAHSLEKLPQTKNDDLNCPDLAIGFYDLVLGFDHQQKRAWIFSSGYPKKESQRLDYAKQRCHWLEQQLPKISDLSLIPNGCYKEKNIISNFNESSYQQAVKKVMDYIYAGDIFEANIAQRFSAPLPPQLKPFDLYRRLCQLNPAPFSAYFNAADIILASASPERFLQLKNCLVETRPIKGTRRRGKTKIEDQALAKELQASEKDHAENIMIVDLMRNDLSRVCLDHSVKVTQLCGLESYATVHHLVSVITGELKEDLTAIDLLAATFPGGSVTGAPKIRAMEIIAEIEPHPRGPYCGSIGYIGFNGDMDTSITIRTYVIKDDQIFFHAGGAIVADSDPASEYQETFSKARALREALSIIL